MAGDEREIREKLNAEADEQFSAWAYGLGLTTMELDRNSNATRDAFRAGYRAARSAPAPSLVAVVEAAWATLNEQRREFVRGDLPDLDRLEDALRRVPGAAPAKAEPSYADRVIMDTLEREGMFDGDPFPPAPPPADPPERPSVREWRMVKESQSGIRVVAEADDINDARRLVEEESSISRRATFSIEYRDVGPWVEARGGEEESGG